MRRPAAGVALPCPRDVLTDLRLQRVADRTAGRVVGRHALEVLVDEVVAVARERVLALLARHRHVGAPEQQASGLHRRHGGQELELAQVVLYRFPRVPEWAEGVLDSLLAPEQRFRGGARSVHPLPPRVAPLAERAPGLGRPSRAPPRRAGAGLQGLPERRGLAQQTGHFLAERAQRLFRVPALFARVGRRGVGRVGGCFAGEHGGIVRHVGLRAPSHILGHRLARPRPDRLGQGKRRCGQPAGLRHDLPVAADVGHHRAALVGLFLEGVQGMDERTRLELRARPVEALAPRRHGGEVRAVGVLGCDDVAHPREEAAVAPAPAAALRALRFPVLGIGEEYLEGGALLGARRVVGHRLAGALAHRVGQRQGRRV